MKKFLLIATFAILSANIFSQKLELGFIGGYQHTNAYAFVGGEINKINFNPKSGPGFNIGGFMLWSFHKNLGMDLQILYSMRSYKFNMLYQEQDTAVIFKRQMFMLELPIHLNYRIKINDEFTIYPTLGASFGVNIHGKDYAYLDTDSRKPIDKATKSDDLFSKSNGRINRFEISPEIGVLIKYKNWGFRPMYSVGVTNLTRSNYGWSFSLPEKQSKYLFNRELKLSILYTFKIR